MGRFRQCTGEIDSLQCQLMTFEWSNVVIWGHVHQRCWDLVGMKSLLPVGMENLMRQLGLKARFSEVRDGGVVDEDVTGCYALILRLEPCCYLSEVDDINCDGIKNIIRR